MPDQIALLIFVRLVANLFRAEPDDHVVTLGDWLPGRVHPDVPVFNGIVRVTVGDFRRWCREAGIEYALGGESLRGTLRH